jgi:hypothetical protein
VPPLKKVNAVSNVLLNAIILEIDEANCPIIKITGPTAAANKPAFTINPCVSGLRFLNFSTKPCIVALN